MSRRVALYARSSANGALPIDEQLAVLRQVAAANAWRVVGAHADTGRLAAKARGGRPGLDALLRQVRSSGLDLVTASSLHQLGRSLSDLLRLLAELRAHAVGLYLHEEALDTATPSGAALFEISALLSSYERALARERAVAGQRRAVLGGVRVGRPPLPAAIVREVRAALASGRGIRETARRCGTSPASVHRVKQGMAESSVASAD